MLSENMHFDFIVDHHLVGAILRVAESGRAAVISHPSYGQLLIDPLARRCALLCDRFDDFCRAAAHELRVSWPAQGVQLIAELSRDLEEVLWHAAWVASDGRLPASLSRHDVLELRDWPNLSRLPSSPDAMRLCSLLARQPHSLHLARKMLGVDEREAYRIYCAGYYAGHLRRVAHTGAEACEDPHAGARRLSEFEQQGQAQGLGSVIRHLWDRLMGM